MNVPATEVKIVSEFGSDAEYQRDANTFLRRHGLDDGYGYTVDMSGRVTRRGKMNLTPLKISKSN